MRPWYYDTEGHYYLEVKIGIKPVELQKDKPAIDVGDKAKLPDTIETVITAVEAGELDNFLMPEDKATAKRQTAEK